jgi:hypothetical protein
MVTLICDQVCIRVIAEQVIPTSSTLSTRTVDRETNPSFYAETLRAEVKITPDLILGANGSLFSFRNLPSQVAYESSINGNSINSRGGPNSSSFAYDFQGLLLGGDVQFQISPTIKLDFNSHFIQNNEAPETYNRAQYIGAGSEIKTSQDFKIRTQILTYFSESDTSPAFYNSSQLGHNNMYGWGAEVSFDFINAGFNIKGKYVDSTPINEDINQSHQQYLLLQVETSNEIL